jgi:outer membrane protein OmpA-like peptidoglycan-associated protein
MIKVGDHLTATVGVLLSFMLAASGCASKKYVSKQIAPVNQKLSQFEKQTDERIAWMNNKEQRDVSQLNERIATTDQNVAQAAAAAQSAQGSASRAMEDADAAKTAADAAKTATDSLQSDMSNALNYKLIDRADVLFAFNKAELTPEAKATLDDIITKYKAAPRGIVELAGFTDPRGTSNYNLGLSRRRTWAVQRYLVSHDVPTRAIHMVGLGEEAPPEGLTAESTEGRATGSRYHQDRRVNIRLYGAGDIGSPAPTDQ